MPEWKTILFDLDGTLTDPAEGITGAVRYALEQGGHPVPPQDILEKFIGPPLDEMFADTCGLSDDEIVECIDKFRVYFAAKGIRQNTIYPGIAPLLAALQQRGAALCLATSKPLDFAKQILADFGIDGYFTHVKGSEMNHAGSHKGDVVRAVLDETGADPTTTVMVGDRVYDVRGAHENGLRCIGLTFGYGGRQELEEAGADYIVDDVEGLAILLGVPQPENNA